jgi:hypothetical protein
MGNICMPNTVSLVLDVFCDWRKLTLPQVDWNDATVKKKADPYHPTSSKDLN